MPETYSELMKTHLGAYRASSLGIEAQGTWRGRAYSHILPLENMMLNILPPIRRKFADYETSHPDLKLHRDFAHLNSSQAACINLFLPLLSGTLAANARDEIPLPFDTTTIDSYEFEYVPNKIEGTNFDFWARTEDRKETFCEFKLTESEFGRAKNDERHRQKLEDIYVPLLTGKVKPKMLVSTRFFSNYQLLRNIAYADPENSVSVLFLVPRANECLIRPLAEMKEWLTPTIRPFVRVLYLEDIVSELCRSLDPHLSAYYDAYAQKYLPSTCGDVVDRI